MAFQPVVSPGIPLALPLNVLFYISCVVLSIPRSSVFPPASLRRPSVITICDHLVFIHALPTTSSTYIFVFLSFSPFRPLYIPQIFLVCSPCFPFCVTSSPWVLSFVPLWETLLPGPSLRTAPKWNYGICSCISRVFLRELGFTVSPSLQEICSPNLTKCAEQHSLPAFEGRTSFRGLTVKQDVMVVFQYLFLNSTLQREHRVMNMFLQELEMFVIFPPKKQQRYVYLIQTFKAVKTVLQLPRYKTMFAMPAGLSSPI